jgi:hypothetical protein
MRKSLGTFAVALAVALAAPGCAAPGAGPDESLRPRSGSDRDMGGRPNTREPTVKSLTTGF